MIRGKNLPMCFVLLSNKKETTYNKIFGMLLQGFTLSQHPKKVYCDFEKAALNAITKNLPKTKISKELYLTKDGQIMAWSVGIRFFQQMWAFILLSINKLSNLE